MRRATVTRPVSRSVPVRRRLLRAVLVSAVLGACLVYAPAALAVETHLFSGTAFGPDGTNGSSFSRPMSLATDASGNVYVAETEGSNPGIEKFGPTGTPIPFSARGTNHIPVGRFYSGPEENQLAVDQQSGAIFATSGENKILAFESSGSPKTFSESANPGTNEIPNFHYLLGVAVDSHGFIYGADYGGVYGSDPAIEGGVAVFSPSGNLLTQFQTPNPGNVAVDAAGDLYVGQWTGEVRKFAPSSYPVTASTTYSEIGVVTGGPTTAIALNPVSESLLVDRGATIDEFNAAGDLLSTFPAPADITKSSGLATTGNGPGEKVFVSDTEGARQVRVYGPLVEAAEPTTGEASEITSEAATLEGLVNPAATVATFQFEYGKTASYGSVSPVTPGPVGSDSVDHPVLAHLTGLEPNTFYHYRLDALNPNGKNTGLDRVFKTPGPVAAETLGTMVRTTTSVLLEGRVNPFGQPTRFHFEYGTTGPCGSASCQSTPDVDVGAGEELVSVAQGVSSLTAGTRVYYRLVAENDGPFAPAVGEDRSVETLPAGTLTHGDFPGPPGSDRAWEQVNTPDTAGHAVSWLDAVSDNGERVVYNVKGGAPQATVGSLYTPLYAERTPSGWVTKNITPPQSLDGSEKGWPTIAASNDLDTILGRKTSNLSQSLWAMHPTSEADRLAESQNLEEGTSSLSAFNFLSTSASGNVSVGAVEKRGEQLFNVTDGVHAMVSTDPNGAPIECGIDIEGNAASSFDSRFYQMPTTPLAQANWVSADGQYAFFSSAGPTCTAAVPAIQIYAHDIDTGHTVRVSSPAVHGATCSAAYITSTSSSVFFYTLSALVAEDDAVPGSNPSTECLEGSKASETFGDIYQYHLQTQTVSCVTCRVTSGPAAVQAYAGDTADAQMAVASDNSRVYFTSRRSLVTGAPREGLYRLNTSSGGLHFIAPIPRAGYRPADSEALSGNGRVLVFAASRSDLNAVGGLTNGGLRQLYIYNDDKEALTCASCPQDGSIPTAEVSGALGGLVSAESLGAQGPNLSSLSADGEVLAFATPTRLVSQDLNTARGAEPPQVGTDIYEWREGRLTLVTDGLSYEAKPPEVAGVAPSGRDIFFQASALLTPDALETAPRLYDARIGGGFEFPTPPPPCPLEVCQGNPPAPPVQPVPGSGQFVGPANQSAARQKKQHKAKKARHGKKHHSVKTRKHGEAKKPAAKHHGQRGAKNDRRAS